MTQLQSYYNEIKVQIDTQYYRCYNVIDGGSGGGYGGGYVFNNDGYSTINLNSDSLINYLTNVYGSVPSSSIRPRFSGTGTINLQQSSIFSPVWTSVYGIPYSAGYGSNSDIMKTDFDCQSTGSNVNVFSGIIDSITGSTMRIKDKGGRGYTVHLGGCTKLETATSNNLPQVGDQVYWMGSPYAGKPSGHYKGYHVTCY